MTIVISVPSGSHARVLLLPLKPLFESDPDIEKVICITPAAPYKEQLFPQYGSKFEFVSEFPAEADIVVTTTSGLDPKDVPILKTAKQKNIPRLTYVESWDNIWKMVKLRKKGKPLVLADHIIVWNEINKQHLLRAFPELSPEQVTAIGSPRLDLFFHEENIPSRKELLKYLGFSDLSRPLIHFSTTELYPMDYVVKAIAEKFPNTNLYASVHPGGNMANHEALKQSGAVVKFSFGRHPENPLEEFKYNPTLEELYMLVALFKHNNLLINHSSTTAIESMLADVPVINVKYGRPLDWWRFSRSPVSQDFREHYVDVVSDGATKVVKNKRQLIQAAKDYLDHPESQRAERAKTLKKMITTTDGTASQKVFQKIKQCAA